MPVLHLPLKTIKAMDKILKSLFSLAIPFRQKNIHTIRWKEICSPLEDSEQGLRDNRENSLALYDQGFSQTRGSKGVSLGGLYYVSEVGVGYNALIPPFVISFSFNETS